MISDFLLYCRLYICLQPILFCTSYHKPPASTLEFKNFDFILQKTFCDLRQKREKLPYPAGSSSVLSDLWPAVARTLSTLRSFQTFLKNNVCNLASKRQCKGECLTKVKSVGFFNHYNDNY